ncbi:predicted protein [Sclerotinia sclerotiorum 1980 UF-70]|uniref:Uncharacterized protein n=1 Tax=Sclerotinia sclerotiorum (strain ATCC 18683 / 1980 / Ss-1) TaxID=665079 RepID=A7E459_SCLS1|nr:predicted protein [Sclerotinia sclerotiorum 1980 UF-70]EDN90681.1 predicted protein [Sclerotinia sclerotiorum 1980 UF-70]
MCIDYTCLIRFVDQLMVARILDSYSSNLDRSDPVGECTRVTVECVHESVFRYDDSESPEHVSEQKSISQ